MYYFTDGIQYMGTAVVTYVHGYSQDITHISGLGGKKTDALHGKIHAHMGNLVTFGRRYANRPFEGDTSLLSSVMYHY